MDHKNSMIKKLIKKDKVDPGTFSFLEPGWWLFHTAAILSIYYISNKINRNY